MGNRKKLFAPQEAQVIALYEAGSSQMDIASQFGVSQTVVSTIIRKAGVSRGPGPRTGTALTPITVSAVVSPEVLHLRSIEGDDTLDPKVRLQASLRLREIEQPRPQTQSRPSCGVPMDSDSLPDYFAGCSLDSPKLKSTPAPTKPWEPSADEQETLDWAEGEAVYGE